MRFAQLLAPTALVVLLAGCGGPVGNTGPVGTGTPTGKEALEDLERLLKSFDEKKQKPPAKLAAIEPVEPVYPGAYIGLVKGDIEYVWGAGLTAGSAAVLAHEKRADTDGGWVLLQDGTVKTMTAAEFAAAPKAGKK